MTNHPVAADRPEHVHDALSAYVDGDLTEEQARQIDAHLATCPECQADYRTLSLTVRALRS